MHDHLTEQLADHYARVALGHVTRPYPNKPGHVLTADDDARTPRDLHPIFFGSFDWHSCVHGYWMLAHLLRRYPTMTSAAQIRDLFDDAFTPDKVAREAHYFAQPATRGFERPYGWAWLLKLASELKAQDDLLWAEQLAPLTNTVDGLLRGFLPRATYPIRVGTHFNTAFALRLAADYADATRDHTLLALLRETATSWYGGDRDCPAWGEPGGDDFLSSALIEAECMRGLLPPEEFRPWFDTFLPRLADGEPAILFRPAMVSDRTDGKIAHLDGLNISRAWCWRALAGALPHDDIRRAIMHATARSHLAASLPHVTGDYMGEHWLASFAVLALSA